MCNSGLAVELEVGHCALNGVQKQSLTTHRFSALQVVTRMLGVEVTGLGLSNLARSDRVDAVDLKQRLADLPPSFEVTDLLSKPIESYQAGEQNEHICNGKRWV